MRKWLRSASLIAAWAFAGTASAQNVSQPPDPEIIVTGRTLDRQVRDFVKTLAPSPSKSQLSRFEWEACPIVLGLSESQKTTVVNRMRSVAEAVDIPLGNPGCSPNVLVAVTRDKRAFIEALSQQLPTLFTHMPSYERRQIFAEPHASAWHVQGPPLNADGRPLELVRLERPGQPPSPEGVYIDRTVRPGSRITASSRLHFSAAVVVVEADALVGLTTTQLGDYAAMRAFANTDPARLPASAPATILNVISAPMGSEVPITMTRWDVALLRGLYASNPRLYAASQRSEIADAFKKELQRPDESRD